MFWKESHFQILRKYWHTESEHDTAARIGVSRKACLQASYRLASTDADFLDTVKSREDDYLFEIIGDMRASVANFQGWSDDQVRLMRQLWHTDLDSRVSGLIGKQKKACVGLALRLRDRDHEFAEELRSREPAYRSIVAQARRANSSSARWADKIQAKPRENVAIKKPYDTISGKHLFVERLLTKSNNCRQS